MATGEFKRQTNWASVEIRKSAPLTINQNNTVSFSTEIDNNTPAGYTFHHIELLGAWPLSTWTNAFVTKICYSNVIGRKSIDLTTTGTQNYSINIKAWYNRECFI